MSNIKKIEYFSLFLLIFFSGSPSIFWFGKEYVYTILLITYIVLFKIYKSDFNREYFLVFFTYLTLIAVHIFTYGTLVFFSSVSFVLQLIMCLILANRLNNFANTYANIIYFLSISSLLFWGFGNIGFPVMEFFSFMKLDLKVDLYNIVIHNFFNDSEINIRNSGVFWEPGAFAGYLCLALFILIYKIADVKNRFIKILVVIITILTTFSTTGYIAATIILISFLLYQNKVKNVYKISFFLILAPILFYGAISLDFIGEKMIQQYEAASFEQSGYEINRFGNLLYDINWIEKKPVQGWGTSPSTRIEFDSSIEELAQGQGNGLTGFIIKFGLIGIIVYFYMCFKSFKKISQSSYIGYVAIILIATLLNGEQFLNYPLFLMLLFFKKNGDYCKS